MMLPVVGNEEQNIDISSVTKLLNIFDDHFVFIYLRLHGM